MSSSLSVALSFSTPLSGNQSGIRGQTLFVICTASTSVATPRRENPTDVLTPILEPVPAMHKKTREVAAKAKATRATAMELQNGNVTPVNVSTHKLLMRSGSALSPISGFPRTDGSAHKCHKTGSLVSG